MSVASHASLAAYASWLVKTSVSPRASCAPRFRVRPWWNSLAGMEWTRAPRLCARSTLPSLRARVDDDDLDLLVDPLPRYRIETAHEVRAAVLHRNDDRDHVGLGGDDELVREERRAQPARPRVRRARRVAPPATGDGMGIVKSSSTTRSPRCRSASTSVLRVKRWTCVRSSNPAVRVAPAPAEEAEPQRPVRDVRRGEDEPSAAFQERPHAREEALRVAQVLDEVAAEHDVEGRRARTAAPAPRRRRRSPPRRRARAAAAVRDRARCPTTVHPRSTSGRARYPLEHPTSSTRFSPGRPVAAGACDLPAVARSAAT